MSKRPKKRRLRKNAQLNKLKGFKNRRKSRSTNPNALPKGSWPAPDGGYYIESGRTSFVPDGQRRIIVTGHRRAKVDQGRLITALTMMAEDLNDQQPQDRDKG